MHFKSFVILASSLAALASAAAVDTTLNTVTNIPTAGDAAVDTTLNTVTNIPTAGAAAVDTTLNTVTNIPTVIVDGLRKPVDSTTLTFTGIKPTGQLVKRPMPVRPPEQCTEEELEEIYEYERVTKNLRQKEVAALMKKYKGMGVSAVPVKLPRELYSEDTPCKTELNYLKLISYAFL
ncbi:hypothetical protein C0992_007148, partial [Termitomyces sp. T32_za158]